MAINSGYLHNDQKRNDGIYDRRIRGKKNIESKHFKVKRKRRNTRQKRKKQITE